MQELTNQTNKLLELMKWLPDNKELIQEITDNLLYKPKILEYCQLRDTINWRGAVAGYTIVYTDTELKKLLMYINASISSYLERL